MIFIIAISLVIHCGFYLLIFGKLAVYKERSNDLKSEKASIVICYKNEEKNIERCLPSIMEQGFDELILVDDNSSDETFNKLNRHKSNKVSIISNKEKSIGKKSALNCGIARAKNNTIILTDADCIPTSNNWVSHMSHSKTSFVLGYGPMNKVKGVVALFARYETYMTALQYLSYALVGIPYMGVGRNMKIDRNLVLNQKDQIRGSHLASGDDDLMINALAKKTSISICIHPESFMYSDPKRTLKAFISQKSRHMTTSVYYRPIHQVLLGLFSGTQVLFYTGLILGLFIGTITLKLALSLLLVKWAIQQAINISVMRKLKELDLLWKFPFLDILHFLYLLIMPLFIFFNKNKVRWS